MIVNANSARIPLADGSVHMVVTSPPYWGLRKYDGDQRIEWTAVTYMPMAGLAPASVEAWRGELGLEPTPELYVAHIVAVFREVWRVLRDDGTLWLNFGDSYAGSWGNYAPGGIRNEQRPQTKEGQRWDRPAYTDTAFRPPTSNNGNLKPKDLVGIPWRVAFALQADGWWLRNDIIWHKPNPMPESVTDRCTKAHEYVFLLAKSERYFYDAEAVKEASEGPGKPCGPKNDASRNDGDRCQIVRGDGRTRNRRTVWTIPTRAYSGAHFATFPPELVAPCILAGTSQRGVCPVCGAPWERVVEKPDMKEVDASEVDRYGNGSAGIHRKVGQAYQDWRDANPDKTTGWRPTCSCDAGDPVPAIVLDPFCGSGTVGEVCRETGRRFVGLDLSSTYLRKLALPRAERKQTAKALAALPMFGAVGAACAPVED